MKAAHTIEAAPERTAPRRIAAEEPVTARIRRRSEAALATLPTAGPEPEATPAEIPPVQAASAPCEEPAPPAVIYPFPERMPDEPARPQTAFRQYVARPRRQNDRQLCLF